MVVKALKGRLKLEQRRAVDCQNYWRSERKEAEKRKDSAHAESYRIAASIHQDYANIFKELMKG